MNCAENKELAQKAKEIRKLTLTSIAKVGKAILEAHCLSAR